MSIEALLAGKMLDSVSGKGLEEAIVLLQGSILEQIRRIPQNQIFLKSGLGNTLSSNVTNDTLILAGFPIPANFRGALEDFNVNFTTVAGTVRIVILDKANNIIQDLLRDISSSTNGTGKAILEEGQKIGIVGQTAALWFSLIVIFSFNASEIFFDACSKLNKGTCTCSN